MDMGGHRFFSKSPEVNSWWEAMLPAQGAPAFDERIPGRHARVAEGGPDPEKTDRVMLIRNRLSRIWFRKKLFAYPISLSPETLQNMGFGTTAAAGFSYLRALLRQREERSLEDFYINRFGRKLYSMFFEDYTAKVWGRHPSELSPDWGAQRVRGLSLPAICRDLLDRSLHRQPRHAETSLIETFKYPKLGPGELWEITADEVRKMGGNFGNDLFSVLFILLTLLLALRWYEEPTLRRILPLAFSIGLGMMAKLSAWTAASSFGMYTLR